MVNIVGIRRFKEVIATINNLMMVILVNVRFVALLVIVLATSNSLHLCHHLNPEDNLFHVNIIHNHYNGLLKLTLPL